MAAIAAKYRIGTSASELCVFRSPGEHNLLNATMAVAACVACGVPAGDAIEALADLTASIGE